ncbi:MAG: transposase, partial [Syntrophothermus sp.]
QLNCTAPCSSSPYGRTVYTKPNDDLRFFTQTPRNSSAWKEIRHKRSAAERSFKRAKIDYELERCRVRSKQAWFWHLHLVGMNQHLDAWVNNATQNGFDIWTVALGQSLAA